MPTVLASLAAFAEALRNPAVVSPVVGHVYLNADNTPTAGPAGVQPIGIVVI
jgi:hypothetical protein